MEQPISQFIENFKAGKYDSPSRSVQIEAGWYDWFCKDSSLKNKTQLLGKKVIQISKSKKVDVDKNYVFFKNNCPVNGSLYDDFRICSMEEGEVIYTIVPRSGHKCYNNRAEVWGRENDFEEPLVTGTWKDVKEFFGV